MDTHLDTLQLLTPTNLQKEYDKISSEAASSQVARLYDLIKNSFRKAARHGGPMTKYVLVVDAFRDPDALHTHNIAALKENGMRIWKVQAVPFGDPLWCTKAYHYLTWCMEDDREFKRCVLDKHFPEDKFAKAEFKEL